MSESNDGRVNPGSNDLPQPDIRARSRAGRVSLIWLVPLVAALIGGGLAVRAYLRKGPSITIRFETADGLAAGKTEVRFKDVVIGQVRDIQLTQDLKQVKVEVDLEKAAAKFATEDTRFWVVRPRVGAGGVSGLGTLLSGAYIGADIGKSDKEKKDFEGLETPPAVTHGMEGRRFELHSNDLGSLDIGSPLYYRRIQVGRVVGYNLDKGGKGVTLQVFVDSPNDRYVTQDARFWNASGVDVTLNSDGFHLNTQSLATVVAGGVAFAPASEKDNNQAKDGARFELHPDLTDAMKQDDGPQVEIVMTFPQSVRGLAVGAAVDFRGVRLGSVTSIELDYNADTQQFPTVVRADIYPLRLGRIYEQIAGSGMSMGDFFKPMVDRGFRAQARRGNLLTGQLYVALDFVPKAEKADFDAKKEPIEIPTQADALGEVQTQIADIVKKIDAIPFDTIGNNLQQTLQGADAFLKQLNTQLAPEATGMLKDARKTLDQMNSLVADDSALQTNTRQTLEEVQRAARSFRALSDYLDRHPDSLLRGKKGDAEIPVDPSYHAPTLTLSPALGASSPSGASR